jgi:hypothetical protein
LPTLLYFLFYSQVFIIYIGVRECLGISPPHIFFNSNKRSDSRAPLKDKLNKRVILAHRTSGTFGFARHTSPTLRKCKAFTNTINNYYAVSKTRRATFCPRTNDDNATLKLNLADYKNFKY